MISLAMAKQTESKTLNIGLWVVQGLLALAFLGAGGGKLTGAVAMVEMFDKIGVGQWFRYVTGLLEVSGAILMLVPGMARYAGALLAVVMVGAVMSHLTILGGSPVAPLVLGVLSGIVAWKRW